MSDSPTNRSTSVELVAPSMTAVQKRPNPGLAPYMLNHAAWITPDAEATTAFYTRIMGMELASAVLDDQVPSTGDNFPYFHIFFRMRDGSTLAFFEAPGVPPAAPPTHPAQAIFNHIALQAKDAAEVLQWHEWLTSNSIDVVGPTDHNGLILSIYFHDPAGIRLEITTPLDKNWNQHTERAYADLKLWVDCKRRAEEQGKDVPSELITMIKEKRKKASE